MAVLTAVDAHAGALGVANDPGRLRALTRYVVLDTSRETEYDGIAQLARTLTGCPVAGIALVDADRVWFKALVGSDATHCPREDSFLGRQLGHMAMRTADDALADEDLSGGQWLPGEPAARGVIVVPLVTGDGYVLGSVFAIDGQPRDFAAATLDGMTALARQVIALLELRRTQLAYHAVIDGAGSVVFHLDAEGRFVSMTPTWSRLTAYGVVRSLGAPLTRFIHPEDRDVVAERLQRIGEGTGSSRFECRIVSLMGAEIPVDVFAQPLLDENRRTVGMVGVLSDISERKAREVESQHAQKMEALGRMSAGIAHEINTPIQFVGDNTRFLAESYETMLKLLLTYREVLDASAGAMPWVERQRIVQQAEAQADVDYLAEEVPSAVAQSLEGVERVASIVRAMKTFSHPGQDEAAPENLNEALEATVTVARNQVKYVADVVMDLGELPPVICHIGDLNQVFLNLIVNAGDAIEDTGEHGTITVITRRDGDHVVIHVADTGTGIPDDIRLKIFEPFFTTKEVGRGTGQGLALARTVVEDRHQGKLSVQSRPGAGSTFTIRLPIDGGTSKENSTP